MTDTLDPLEELDRRIVELVEQSWSDDEMPLLLSRLGAQDGGDIARLAKQEAFSLAAYLRDRLEAEVQVIQHSSKPVMVGAIPADVEGTPSEFDTWLERTHGPTPGLPKRFHRAFWAAFRVPLDDEMRRYMSLVPPLRFTDAYPEDRPEGDTYLEVEREYIDSDVDAGEVQENVEDWLDANGLDAAPFLAQPRPGAGPGSGSLLDSLLNVLDLDEQRRLSLPLDIVAKLRRS